ncbi:hypothetical protein E2C01_080181 [Portunus trituberculatus]|uniref:Uncharacterized protein n=1 Tax=Portunus trituberculatus TaxID=210409 RepID=A0A5B7ITC5_PORTR|nr:hypothetical protein [Portunus trituberculatus]
MAEGASPCLTSESPATHCRCPTTSSAASPFPSPSQSSSTPLSFLTISSSRNSLLVFQQFPSPPPYVSLSFSASVPPQPSSISSLPFFYLLHVLLSFSSFLHHLPNHHFTFLCLLSASPSPSLHTLFLPRPPYPSFLPHDGFLGESVLNKRATRCRKAGERRRARGAKPIFFLDSTNPTHHTVTYFPARAA